ncbi:amidohydrolase family protein [Sphingomonas soli]|uniref:amidohydrolase family protein n=1 Tax=Sphingomonas soli TaxID=266127 RepID=UPI000834A154|nr:amidohydrolase family protein [Sphingomonas soli]
MPILSNLRADRHGRSVQVRHAFPRRAMLRLAAASCLLAIGGCVAPERPSAIPLYDTHAHFFSPDTARYPQDTRGAREGEEQLRARIAAHPNTPETVLPVWQAHGVAGGVAVQYNEAYKRDNRFVLDSGDRFPDKIAVVVILDPLAPESGAELRRLAHERGVTGVRITGRPDADGNYIWLDAPTTQEMWRVADELRLAVVIMTLPAEVMPGPLAQIAALAARFPNARVVLDHIGWAKPGADLDALRAAVGARSNVYFKLTTVNLELLERAGDDPAAYVRRVVDLFGADRVMWGSDFGRSALTFEAMVHRLAEATEQLTPLEKRKLMHDTGYRIFRRK